MLQTCIPVEAQLVAAEAREGKPSAAAAAAAAAEEQQLGPGAEHCR
jgi:hypothetical protein